MCGVEQEAHVELANTFMLLQVNNGDDNDDVDDDNWPDSTNAGVVIVVGIVLVLNGIKLKRWISLVNLQLAVVVIVDVGVVVDVICSNVVAHAEKEESTVKLSSLVAITITWSRSNSKVWTCDASHFCNSSSLIWLFD